MADGISPVAFGFFALVTAWLIGLTYVVVTVRSHYNSLIKINSKQGLQEVFDRLLKEAQTNRVTLENLTVQLREQEKRTEFTFQKVGLLRFNPFSNTGGEQSFTVALLDIHNNGIVITALQGRTGMRWYAKKIKRGKGVDFELSKEEQEAISSATQVQ